MDDLISRAAAIKYLMTNMGWHDEDGYEVDDAEEKRKIITDLIDGIPTVDAVPVVVRCKDCHYCNTDIAVGGWYGSCRYWNTHSVMDNDFCSRGRLKWRA